MLNPNRVLMVIDQLSSEGDWIHYVKEQADIEIASRIKATPTSVLKAIVEGMISESADNAEKQSEFALKELLYRKASDSLSEQGDPHYIAKTVGYDKLDKNLHEKLTADDPVEDWIADFVASDNPKFDGKSKKERIKMALGAYYGAQKKNESLAEKRAVKILELATKQSDGDLLRFFYESDNSVIGQSTLKIRDLYESFVFQLTEAAITIGSKAKVKCIQRWGACKVGEVYDGVWKQAAFAHQLRLDLWNLPSATSHPSIFFDKNTKQVSIPKQFELL